MYTYQLKAPGSWILFWIPPYLMLSTVYSNLDFFKLLNSTNCFSGGSLNKCRSFHCCCPDKALLLFFRGMFYINRFPHWYKILHRYWPYMMVHDICIFREKKEKRKLIWQSVHRFIIKLIKNLKISKQ